MTSPEWYKDWDWDREEEEYYRYLEELERERWDRDSLARMRDSSFAVSLQLRSFLEFSDLILRRELAGDLPADPWAIWRSLRDAPKRRRRLSEAPLSRWLGRTDNFANFVERTQELLPSDLPLERRVLATQMLLKSWVDEISTFALGKQSTWQSIAFFYSVESTLAAVVNLLSDTDITSHADVLNQFRSLILCPLRSDLFPPIEFAYRRIRGTWTCDRELPTNSLVEMCPLIVRAAMQGRHGDWITYFHLLHTVSEIYRYRSVLPFLMTDSPRLRSYNTYVWDLNLTLKLWLEVLVCTAMGREPMADLVKMARHRFLVYHKADISSLELRWSVMQQAGFLDLTRQGLSRASKQVFQAIRRAPLGAERDLQLF